VSGIGAFSRLKAPIPDGRIALDKGDCSDSIGIILDSLTALEELSF